MRAFCRKAMVACGIVCVAAVTPVAADLCPESVGPWPRGGIATVVAVSGDHAYLGSGAMLLVVEVGDPTEPAVVGQIELSSMIRDMAVSGDHVYVIDRYLHVIDVSDPASPVEVGSLELTGDPDHIDVSRGFAYLAGYDLRVVDVVDPSLPVEVGFHPGETRNVIVFDDYAYISTAGGVRVLDVSDPTSPTGVRFLATDGEVGDIAIDGGYGFLTESGSPSHLRVIDLSQPDDPVTVGLWEAPRGYGAFEVQAFDSVAYLGSRDSGVMILDVENPYFPTPIGHHRSHGALSDLAIARDRLFVVEADGLRIVDVDPPGPVELGSVEFLGIAEGVVIDGDIAYIANTYMGLRLINVSDPEDPAVLSAIDTSGEVHDVVVAGDLAYLADGEAGLLLVDVGNPASPVVVGVAEIPGRAVSVDLLGDLALVAAESAGLRVIDVSTPGLPVEVGSYQPTGDAIDVVVFGNDALVVDSWDDGTALRRVSLSNPSNPYVRRTVGSFWHERARAVTVADGLAYVATDSKWGAYAGLSILDPAESGYGAIRGSCGFPGTAYGVFVHEDMAFVSAAGQGMQIVDISDSWSPQPTVVATHTLGLAMDIAVSDTTAYVAAGNAGLRVFDISQPRPLELGFVATPGSSRGIAADGGYAFVAGNAGFQTYDLDDPKAPEIVGSVDIESLYWGGRISVSENLAVVLDWGGLSILDVSEPESPVFRGSFYNQEWLIMDGALVGSVAYLAGMDFGGPDENGGLIVVDISDPSAPVEATVFETPGYTTGVVVQGTTAFSVGYHRDEDTQDWMFDLRVIDIEDPFVPIEVGLLQSAANFSTETNVAVSGSHVFVSGDDLRVFDVSDPASPVEVGFLADVSGLLEVVGKYVLVGGRRGVQIVDAGDPTSPVEVGFAEAPAEIGDMAVYGRYLHLACGDAGVRVVDLSGCPGYIAPPPTPRQGEGRVTP